MLKSALGLFLFCIIVLVIFLPSYTKMQDLKQKEHDSKKQIQQLSKKNRQLKLEKKMLETDPIYLEKVAREKMGLIREGEVVYQITPMDPAKERESKAITAPTADPAVKVIKLENLPAQPPAPEPKVAPKKKKAHE